MPVTATSQIAKAKHALRALVAASTSFQTAVGAANATEALEFVYLGQADDSENENDPTKLKQPRPRAIIAQQSFSLSQGVGERQEQFGLVLSFEIPPPESVIPQGPGYNINDECTWFDNLWGAILTEMADNGFGSDTYFAFTSIEVIDGPSMNDPDQDPVQEYYWGVALTVMGPFP